MSQGHSIFWASLDTGESSQLLRDGVNFYSLSFPRRILSSQIAIASLQLYKLIHKLKPDIMITASALPSWLSRIVCILFPKIKILYIVHSWFWDDRTPWYKRWSVITLEYLASLRTNHFVFINREDLNDGITYHVCKKRNADCIDSVGIKLDEFDLSKVTKERLELMKSQLFLPKEIHYLIGFVGRMINYKGIVELAQAFCLVRKSFSNAGLICIGKTSAVERDQRAFSEFKSYIIRQDLTSCLKIIPYVEDLPAMMALFDILVLPSRYEGYGLVLLEAGAMKKPVIACDIRGVREAVIDGETGILVPPKKIKPLSEAIILLLSNPELRNYLGKQGYIHSKNYGRNERVQKLINIIAKVLQNKKP